LRESSIILEGKLNQFVRSEAGNLAFMLEESDGSLHYCFSPIKDVSLGISDDLLIYGSQQAANKVRINYILNKTRNTEAVLIERKQSWTYTISLIFSIIVTVLFVISLLFLLRVFPINYSTIGSIFNFIFSLIMVIMLVPVLIILWVLTSVFNKNRSENKNLTNSIEDIKKKLGIAKSSITLATQSQIEVQSESEITGAGKYCSHCGEKLLPEARFCSKCGAKWE